MANQRGRQGEAFAKAKLISLGYIIERENYYTRYGEVDLIARNGGSICFVEVKTRRQNAMVDGLQAVSPSKQRKIIKSALLYLQETGCMLQPRFDVFCIVTDSKGAITDHIYLTGAFDGEAYEEHPQGF